MADQYQEIECATAEDLLDHLTPHRGTALWGRPIHDGWAFRGQSESVWKLTPKAHRAPLGTAFQPFIPGQKKMYPVDAKLIREMELSMVGNFANKVSGSGLEIPFDSHEFRDYENQVAFPATDFPPPRLRGLFALAQHYGVPTRLLDWTSAPLVAAYFAAKGASKSHSNQNCDSTSDHRLAVWALDMRYVTGAKEWTVGPVLVNAPTANNPNLYAQKGSFTLMRYKAFADEVELVPPTIDEYIRNFDSYVDGVARWALETSLFKFTLPHEEAGRLLYFVYLNGIDASTVYPGHHSLVEAMQEQDLRSVTRPGMH